MPELFDTFPCLENEMLIIKKMTANDVDALAEITSNQNVYRYIPPFLYKKSKKALLTAISNLGGRDFEKKKMIIAGIYLQTQPEHLIGLAEIFDYKKRTKEVTIGYRIHESYWHRGIATNTVAHLVDYLSKKVNLPIIHAFVIPENIYSAAALCKNGFVKEPYTKEDINWGGRTSVTLNVYTYM